MPKEKPTKQLCVDALRHSEYYEMQDSFDDLYARSKRGEIFTDLLGLIFSRENVLLAYRNIKMNAGSNTPGTDGVTIHEIGQLSPEMIHERVLFIVKGSQHGYRPRVNLKTITAPLTLAEWRWRQAGRKQRMKLRVCHNVWQHDESA